MTAEETFSRYHEAVFRFAYRLTRCVDTAEDITQDCFLTLVRSPGSFDESRGTVKTYLFSVTRNLALKHYRDHRSEVPIENGDYADRGRPSEIAVTFAVERAVAALPVLQQEALILFQYEGCTIEEIAAIAGADAGTIKSRLHRARAGLKKALAPYKSVGGVHGTV